MEGECQTNKGGGERGHQRSGKNDERRDRRIEKGVQGSGDGEKRKRRWRRCIQGLERRIEELEMEGECIDGQERSMSIKSRDEVENRIKEIERKLEIGKEEEKKEFFDKGG